MYGYIYKTTNLINGKIYIGKHKSLVFDVKYYGSGLYLKAAIAKYGIDNFKCELVEWCDTLKDLNLREIYWIKYFNSQSKEIGYNISSGGDGLSPVPESVKDKLRKANLGKKYNEDSLKIRRKAQLGKHHLTDEQIKMLAEARRRSGCYHNRKKMSEETKQKIGNKNRHPNDWIWITDGKTNLRIKNTELDVYKEQGYYKGRTISWATR